jgi:hypothetical protein
VYHWVSERIYCIWLQIHQFCSGELFSASTSLASVFSEMHVYQKGARLPLAYQCHISCINFMWLNHKLAVCLWCCRASFMQGWQTIFTSTKFGTD